MSAGDSLCFVAQVGLEPTIDAEDREAFARGLAEAGKAIEGIVDSHAAAHLDLSVGGLDLTWDLRAQNEDAARAFEARLMRADGFASLVPELASRVAAIEMARPEVLSAGVGLPGLVGVKRTLWLRVEPEATLEAVARFEAETPLLAEAIPAIRNWRWSRLPLVGSGPSALRWTHPWEQEFETVAGLEVDYMSSPAHWGFIDRWFDPEMPDRIVDLWLAHTACLESAPVLSWGASSSVS